MTKWIKVSDEIHTELLNLGKKGETFDAVLRRLLKSDRGAAR